MDPWDILYNMLVHWIPMRDHTAHELFVVADQLDHLHHESTVAHVAGSSVAAVGSLAVIGAGLLTFFTAGLGTPALVMAVGGTAAAVTGTATSGIASLVEHFKSSDIMNHANIVINQDQRLAEEIHHRMSQLLVKCTLNHSCNNKTGPATEFMKSVARHHGLVLPQGFFNDLHTDGIDVNRLALYGGLLGLSNMKLISKNLFADLELIGIRFLSQETAQVLGGAFGLAFAVPELVKSSMDLAKNEPTEASSQLRHTARTILRALQKLKENLRPIEKMFSDMAMIKRLVKKLNYTSHTTQEGQQIVDFVMQHSQDKSINAWLQDVRNRPDLLNNIALFYKAMRDELEKKSTGQEGNHINIAFIAHGRISPEFIPPNMMIPLGTIDDVIIYSPWNCYIDYKAGFMIASGRMDIANRIALNHASRIQPPYLPNPLPSDWNRMSQARSNIPLHWVKAVGLNEQVWRQFMNMNSRATFTTPPNWFVLPYLKPDNAPEILFPEVPFFAVSLALAVMFWGYGRRATIHLAACAAYGSDAQNINDWHRQMCISQYAYALDDTYMSNDIVPDADPQDLQAFRTMFGSPA